MFQLVIVDKKATSGHILQGAKKWKLVGVNQDYREDEGEQSSPLLPLPPLCADWCVVFGVVVAGIVHSSSCLAEPLEFVVLTSMVTVHIALN